MTRCATCGVDAGFPIAICPSCGARAGNEGSSAGAPDGRTVLANEATVGPARDATIAVGCFLAVDGPDTGTKFLVTRTSVVGRGRDAGIRLNDPRVSTRHANLHVEGNRVVYQDLGATNGSYLRLGAGRQRLRGPHVVSDGDEVVLGSTVLRYIQLRKEVGR